MTLGRRISFDDGRYYFITERPSFTLRGKMTILEDRSLTIDGPVNSFEANLTGGRVVEGNRLAGLLNTTIHIEAGVPSPTDTVGSSSFQLSRAIKVGQTITFRYRLVARSGGELGVIRLPLRYGEDVLEVEGVEGWRVEGTELLLPTTGSSASIDIVGTLPRLGQFTPDLRSAFEWWLLESDAEHRLSVEGSARQFDIDESPLRPSLHHSRLFMVQRGQRIEVTSRQLVPGKVLAAAILSHKRRVVLTAGGEVIAQDEIQYGK